MLDPWAFIAESAPSIHATLSDVLETRAADPDQRSMLQAYLSELAFRKGAKVLEVGCGTGAVCRSVMKLLDCSEVIGIDPSPVFLERARKLGARVSGLSFRQGDGRALDFADESFDVVMFHTSLCHIPTPEKALQEAHRVLRPNGWISAFDGDYVTTTVALCDCDPLQPVVDAMMAGFVHNRWFTRQIPRFLESLGFVIKSVRGHAYTQTKESPYMLTVVDRGANLLAAEGRVSTDQAEAFKCEARRRVKAGEFFGHISYISVIARKSI